MRTGPLCPSAIRIAALRITLADLTLEAAHARLARVAVDDRTQHLVADLHLIGLETVGLELTLHQVTPRDLPASRSSV